MKEISAARAPRRGDILTVRIESLDARGHGLGRHGPDDVRVSGAIPGALVRAKVSSRSRGRIDARFESLVEAGPDAVAAPCPHVPLCGGCAFQGLAYPAQLAFLQNLVADALRGAGLEPEAALRPVIPCAEPFGYRNKMDFTFSDRRYVPADEPQGAPAAFALGLHVSGFHAKVLDVARCDIQFPGGNGFLGSVRELAKELGLDPWNLKAHRGLLRHLVLRQGRNTGETMVNLVTSEAADGRLAPFFAELLRRHPEITTIVQNVHQRVAAVAHGGEEVVRHGPGVIHEVLDGLRFAISANTFFQTNTAQAERLLREVVAAAGPAGGGVAWDLYCGCGTLSLALARRAREVVGFELVDSAIADARRNAALNDVRPPRFLAGDVLATIAAPEAAALARPDLVVVDPPRAGLHPKVLAAVAALRAPRVVYVSCNVGTAAPQLARLRDEAGYRLVSAQPIDMFPHTPHVECVFAMER
jgi:23S rRNA (uracil1939-C5)-methyltransferase